MKKLLISLGLILTLAAPGLAQSNQLILKGSTSYPLGPILIVDSSDHVSGKTGCTPSTKKISKGFGSSVTPSGTWTELDSTNHPGIYYFTGNATDTNADGPITAHIVCSGADPFDGVIGQVVEFDPRGATPSLSDIENQILNALCSSHTTSSSIGNTLCTALTIPKGVAQPYFPIWFKDSTNTGVPGLSDANIHCYTQKDNGSFAETTNTSQTDVGRGKYLQPLSSTELNGNTIALDCTATSGGTTYHYTTSFSTNH